MLPERDAELAVLATALRSAERGSGSLVLLRGPLGCGRSALLHAARDLAGAAGAVVLRASASRLEQDFALGVVRQLFGTAGSGTESLRALVDGMGRDRAVTLLVDDLHRADEPSLRWLGDLAPRLSGLPVLVVATVRDGDPRSASPVLTAVTGAAGHVLRPAPLSPAGVRAVVAAETGQAPGDGFVAACHDTTCGNPLFLTSLLLHLANDGVPPDDAHADLVRSRRPPHLRPLLVACFHEYPEAVRACVNALTVLDGADDRAVLCRVAGVGVDDGVAAVAALGRLGVLVRRGAVEVLHPMVLDAIQDTLTPEQRERLHLRAAEVLRTAGHDAERVAAQLMAISAPHDRHAIRTLRAAAGSALARGAPDVASGYLRRALLGTSPAGEDRGRLLVELAGIERTVDVRASVRHIASAVPLLRSARERAAAVAGISQFAIGAATPAVPGLIEQISGELGDPADLTGADRDLGLLLEARLRHLGRTGSLRRPCPVARLDELGGDPPMDTAAERELLTVLLYAVMIGARRPAAEIACLGERILEREPPSPSHVHSALPLLVETLVAAEAVASLGPWLESAAAVARRQGAVLEQALICTEQAAVALRIGRFGDAKAAALEARGLAALDWDIAQPATAVILAGVAIAAGDPDLGARPLADSPAPPVGGGFAGVRRMLQGAVAAGLGDQRAALEHHLEGGRLLERAGWHNPVLFPWRAEAVGLLQQLGDADAARALAEENLSRAVEWGTPTVLGRARRVLGALRPGPEGLAMVREAVATLELSVNRAELARGLLALADRLQADGESAEAVIHLRRCRQLAADCGDRATAERAEAGLSAVTRAVTGSGLSEAEQRVAGLVGAGLGNQQIADRLGVGRRTVEKHLTSVYRKLGVHGRAELTDAVQNGDSG